MDPKARLQFCLAEFNSQEGLARQQALHKTSRLPNERACNPTRSRLQPASVPSLQPYVVQALHKSFSLLDEWGPSHERMYLVGCYINPVNARKRLVAQARGQSLMDAQMGAASKALVALGLDSAEGGVNQRA